MGVSRRKVWIEGVNRFQNVSVYIRTFIKLCVPHLLYLGRALKSLTIFCNNRAIIMDVVRATKQYISRMIADAGVGMKTLIMDKETVSRKDWLYYFNLSLSD